MFQPQNLGKILVTAGVLLLLLGLLFLVVPKSPLLSRLLEPMRWQKGPVTIYFPWGLSILISLLLTLIFYFWRRW